MPNYVVYGAKIVPNFPFTRYCWKTPWKPLQLVSRVSFSRKTRFWSLFLSTTFRKSSKRAVLALAWEKTISAESWMRTHHPRVSPTPFSVNTLAVWELFYHSKTSSFSNETCWWGRLRLGDRTPAFAMVGNGFTGNRKERVWMTTLSLVVTCYLPTPVRLGTGQSELSRLSCFRSFHR